MEKGQMRVEGNISVSASGELGTKVEVKNVASFRQIQAAIDYEIKRQKEVLESGEKVIQETRGWDDVNKKTVSQRLKEDAHDYRYFPEPDLPPLDMSKFDLAKIKLGIPELPQAKRQRFIKEYGLSVDQSATLVASRHGAEYFEQSVSELKADAGKADFQLLANYFNGDLRALLLEKDTEIVSENGELLAGKITAENFADLVKLVQEDKITSRVAKDVLKKMFENGMDPTAIVAEEGLVQISDESKLEEVVKKVIGENPKAVEDYKKGKENAVQFLVGKSMAQLKGAGNPEVLRELFKKNIL